MGRNLIILLAGTLIAGVLAIYWNSQKAPVGHSMTPPNTSDIAQGDPIVAVKLPDELSAQATLGEVAFNVKCSACHGTNAAGKNGFGPPLIYKTYERSHHGDEAFQRAAAAGVQSHHWRFGNMPPVDGLTRGDVKNIVAYIREIQRVNGID